MPSPNEIEELTQLLEFYAELLVTLGVYLETREILQEQSTLKTKNDVLNHFLNRVAETNGSGLLIIGLFLDCFIYALAAPNKFIDTSGVEFYILFASLLFALLAIPISIDLILDYIKSYFNKNKELLEKELESEK